MANAIHDRDRISDRFVLPEPEDAPPIRDQHLVSLDISFPIARNLCIPVIAIDSRPLVVHRAPVPEAPVDEYSESCAGEDDVCGAPECGQRSEVDSVTKPLRMQELSDQQLGQSVSTLVRHHAAPVSFGRRPRFSAGTHVVHLASKRQFEPPVDLDGPESRAG
jgi:hypothetical protein